MLIAYASMTGNVRRFINRLSFPTINLKETQQIDEPYVLVTYTFNFGDVPQEVKHFLDRHINNRRNLVGVAASGNRNWGSLFARSADIIATKFRVPILHKFELAGSEKDVQIFTEKVREIEQISRNQCTNGCAV